jgi:hypothetical protein
MSVCFAYLVQIWFTAKCLSLNSSSIIHLFFPCEDLLNKSAKVSKSRKQILKFSLAPKNEGKYFCISVLAYKKKSNQKSSVRESKWNPPIKVWILYVVFLFRMNLWLVEHFLTLFVITFGWVCCCFAVAPTPQKILLINPYFSGIKYPYIFDVTSFLRLGQKYKNIFVHLLVQVKTLIFAFEIYWPLAHIPLSDKY